MKKKDRYVGVEVEVNLEDIAYLLNPTQAMELIKMIDLAQEEWEFTLQVADHFDKLRKVYEEEVSIHD